MEHVIKIKINGVDADKEYYSFYYTIELDGEKYKEGLYESDYCNGMTPKEWKTALIEDKIAMEIVLEQMF